MKKRRYATWSIIVISLVAVCAFFVLQFTVIGDYLHFDFTQDYRKIDSVEKIIFTNNWTKKSYCRSFWGLQECKTGNQDSFKDEWFDENRTVYSPDGKYFLYVEVEYNYYNSTLTDDEYCYYKVKDLETGEEVTVYQGYRQWYAFHWEK